MSTIRWKRTYWLVLVKSEKWNIKSLLSEYKIDPFLAVKIAEYLHESKKSNCYNA